MSYFSSGSGKRPSGSGFDVCAKAVASEASDARKINRLAANKGEDLISNDLECVVKGCRPRSPWRPAADQRSVRNSRYSICNLESPQRPASLSPEQESCRGLSAINFVTDLKLELFGVAVSCTSEEQAGLACWRLRELSQVPNFSCGNQQSTAKPFEKGSFRRDAETSTRDACAPQPPVTS